jgi:replicative DNA helicase
MSVLGSVFVDQSSIKSIIDKLDTDDFYSLKHKVIYNAMVDLFQSSIDIDYMTLSDLLKSKGLLNEAGGLDYILGLIKSVPSIVNLSNYINIVKDKSMIRKMLDAARQIIEDGYKTDDANSFVDLSEKMVFDIAKDRRTSDFIRISEVTEQVIVKTEQAKDNHGDLTGLDTGFTMLNRYTLGLQPTELIILAARPSMGKSAFALNIARNVAKVDGLPTVAFFSLEMGSDQLVSRMLSSESRIQSTKIRTGSLSNLEWQQLNVAQENLSKLNIVFDDSGTVKVTDLRQKCRKLKQDKGLDLVIIDYLQLLSGSNPGVNRVNEVSEISRVLKEMARELKIPVLALSQLSRAVEKRDDKKPVMADLRESGSIEQDADIILFLYREDYYNKDSQNQNQVDVMIAKNRSGATTTHPIKLSFNRECSYFENMIVSPDEGGDSGLDDLH